MTTPFVFNVHKNFANRMKETGCDEQAITSHLQNVLLADEEIEVILQELTSETEQSQGLARSHK